MQLEGITVPGAATAESLLFTNVSHDQVRDGADVPM